MIARARSVIVRLAGVSLLTGAGLIVSASPASAGNPPILVNTGADPPPGACQQPPAGDCSLREAYALAAATANPDTIVVDDGVNAINLNGFINFTDTEAITLLGNTTTITQTASNAGILWQESSGPLTVDAATLTGVTGNTPIPAIFSSTGDVTLTNAALVNNS